MTRYGFIGWRLTAVAAFVGTAALAIVLTQAPRSHPSPAGALTDITCPASGLRAWLGLASDTVTVSRSEPGTNYTLEFTNISAHPCRLYGYPEVTAYSVNAVLGSGQAQPRHGQAVQVGSAAVPDPSVRPEPVTLDPGATAHSVLRVASTGTFRQASCAQVTAQYVRVMLPGPGRPAYVPVRLPACSRKGTVFLKVQAIQARPGVPGYTMPEP